MGEVSIVLTTIVMYVADPCTVEAPINPSEASLRKGSKKKRCQIMVQQAYLEELYLDNSRVSFHPKTTSSNPLRVRTATA